MRRSRPSLELNLRARALALLLVGLSASACGAEAPVEGPASGVAVASTVELADLDGIEGALAARRGKALLLNLWAMW